MKKRRIDWKKVVVRSVAIACAVLIAGSVILSAIFQ